MAVLIKTICLSRYEMYLGETVQMLKNQKI